MKDLDFNTMMEKLSEIAGEDLELNSEPLFISKNAEIDIEKFNKDEFKFDDFLDEETKQIIFSK